MVMTSTSLNARKSETVDLYHNVNPTELAATDQLTFRFQNQIWFKHNGHKWKQLFKNMI